MNPFRTLLVVSAVGLALTAVQAQASATRPADPWPSSAVLTRLFVLPSGRADSERLSRELRLTPAQTAELRRLARGEAAAAQAGRQVFGRDEATALNAKIARLSAEKDRKVRLSLAGKYSSFRGWVRTWWRAEVSAAR
ncbi:hypothetical protein [Deinococcus sp. QL22]|uniref:hypothetical protein n=1 Tax=Deinococcus sp. QL22 TaxID=2939437 RepID=UPI0020170752|nr:hypothetical protein [Deinococcus sp. QL22]UQN05825.1 hypothetical protein M1R55_13265 [Deinococcus sp. QL22]